MAETLEFTIDKDDLNRILAKLRGLSIAQRGGQESVLYKAFRNGTLVVERRLKENVSGTILKVRSGRLRASMGSIVLQKGENLEGTIGSGVRQGERVKYANIHETGGVITPKNTKFLTIPLKAALTASGVQRFTARDVMAGATKYSDSYIHNGVIFGIMSGGRGEGADPLFILKRSVTIPARHYLSRTLTQTQEEVVSTMEKAIDGELRK
jgi:phage gpG-like protein